MFVSYVDLFPVKLEGGRNKRPWQRTRRGEILNKNLWKKEAVVSELVMTSSLALISLSHTPYTRCLVILSVYCVLFGWHMINHHKVHVQVKVLVFALVCLQLQNWKVWHPSVMFAHSDLQNSHRSVKLDGKHLNSNFQGLLHNLSRIQVCSLTWLF